MDRFKFRSRELRKEQTLAEDILWRELRGRRLGHWKFRRQHPIARYGRLVVEVDGATHSTDRERERDARRTRDLEHRGFHVLRVTNTEVYKNLDGVLEAILHELGSI